jgi:dinuclear metal center YbgI/SA1388 family protein
MVCTVGDIAAIMEQWAPADTVDNGDNVGLLAGFSSRNVGSVLIALDVNEGVIEHAASVGANMIIAHHPFIYRPISSVSDTNTAGRLAALAISAGVAVFAAHTNLDRATGGVNDVLCEVIGLTGAKPAFEGGIGRMAALGPVMALNDFAMQVKVALDAPIVRVTGREERLIKKLYIVSGAGRHDIGYAIKAGADCMLTGELGYHDAQEALACGLCVVEAGHYDTEKPVLKHIEKHLQSQFQRLQYNVRTAVYEKTTCPFYYFG